MEIEFLGQPFQEWDQAGVVLKAAILDPDAVHVWIATAWAKRSGLGRLRDELRDFSKRGGHSEIIVGVDEGGATVEGLRLTLELFDNAYVFHDPGPRTFHTKLYAVETADTATLLVGSANLTRGGLFTNYEASVLFRLDKGTEAEHHVLEAPREYFELLLASKPSCQALDAQLIEELRLDDRVVVRSERVANRRRAAATKKGPSSGRFGVSVQGLRGAPPSSAPPLEDEDFDSEDLTPEVGRGTTQAAPAPGAGPPPAQPPPAASPTPAASPAPAAPPPPAAPAPQPASGLTGFFKALSQNDVSLRDSPGQIIIPVAFLPFFGPLTVQKDESSSGGPRQEQAFVPVNFVDGAFQKTVTARVILYEPAATHKRQNSEVRFTFRDRDILTRLAKDDVLAFSRSSATGNTRVDRHGAGWRPPSFKGSARYGPM